MGDDADRVGVDAGVAKSVVGGCGVSWPKVVLFGDSLTEYAFSPDGTWGAVLADRLQRRCDVVTRGFCGYNSRMCRAVLPSVFAGVGEAGGPGVTAVTIFLGANDSNDAGKNPQQHVPLDEYAENLAWMVKFLEERGVERSKVILISPPAFNGPRWAAFKGFPEPTKDYDTTKKYAQACVEVAEDLGCDVVDLFDIMETKFSDSWNDLLNDGLHLSARGSRVLADALWPLIEKRTQHLPNIFPAWDQMDNQNPVKSADAWISSNRKC